MLAGRNNMFTVARGIVRTTGVQGLWKGCVPTVLANAPFSAIYYSVYTGIRNSVAFTGWPQAGVNFSAGLVAAMVATLATQPSDVIRSRAQLTASKIGTLAWASRALGSDGGRVFLAGATPRVLKRTLQTALVWTMYEQLLPVIVLALAKASDRVKEK
jgi:solute carrier family 25, member 38